MPVYLVPEFLPGSLESKGPCYCDSNFGRMNSTVLPDDRRTATSISSGGSCSDKVLPGLGIMVGSQDQKIFMSTETPGGRGTWRPLIYRCYMAASRLATAGSWYGFGQISRDSPTLATTGEQPRYGCPWSGKIPGSQSPPLPDSRTRWSRFLSREAGGTNLGIGAMFSHFTPETVELLTTVQKAAVQEWEATKTDATPMLKALAEVSVARALLDAAASGDRDPERLKNAALAALEEFGLKERGSRDRHPKMILTVYRAV